MKGAQPWRSPPSSYTLKRNPVFRLANSCAMPAKGDRKAEFLHLKLLNHMDPNWREPRGFRHFDRQAGNYEEHLNNAAGARCLPRSSTTAGIAVINWAAMEAWSWPQWMKLSIGRVSWMRWLSRSRRVFAGLSRAGGYGPICRACLLLWSARTAGNWPRMPAIARPMGCRIFSRACAGMPIELRDDLQAYVVAQLGDADAV